ncbi:MAG: hypothetical protein M0T70_01115 [Geobacteraceae bacterium]|nr:hypothetical protein [Geobacteraceae bacterium]
MFFDFSPFENPVFGDYRIRFHVYTLPGKVVNPAAWKMTLKGADGVVIVADASPEHAAAAQASISELRSFLAAYGVGLNDIPCVIQLNERSVPGRLPASGTAAALNLPKMQACFSDSESGEGVLETLSLLSREIMTRIRQDDVLQGVERDVMPEIEDDAEVSAALVSLEMKPDAAVNESILMNEEKTLPMAVVHDEGDEPFQVVMAEEGAVCNDGVVRIPLEFTLRGNSRRLVISIAIDDSEQHVPIKA